MLETGVPKDPGLVGKGAQQVGGMYRGSGMSDYAVFWEKGVWHSHPTHVPVCRALGPPVITRYLGVRALPAGEWGHTQARQTAAVSAPRRKHERMWTQDKPPP